MNTPELQLDSPNTGLTKPAPVAGLVDTKLSPEELNVSMAIGPDDVVEGRIRVGKNKTLVVRGTVDGEIISQGTVLVLKGARVMGKIIAASLSTEGDIGDAANPAQIEVGDLHIGVDSRTVADCIYVTMCVLTPNRGIRGQMLPRDEVDSRDA